MQRAARPVHARNSTRSILNRNPEAFNPGAPTSLVTEREGFEPSTHLSARTRFPVALLRPLGHLSEPEQSTRVVRNGRRDSPEGLSLKAVELLLRAAAHAADQRVLGDPMGRQKLSRTIDLDGVGQLSRGLVGLFHQAGGPKDVDDVLPADQ